jgi:hypothetical protein
VFRQLLRTIDLAVCVSARARASVTAAGVSKVPASVMYAGGLELTAADLLPHFRQGKPGSRLPGEVFIVVARESYGAFPVHRALHAAGEARDTWMWVEASGLGRRYDIEERLETDYWLTDEEYQQLFRALANKRDSKSQRCG